MEENASDHCEVLVLVRGLGQASFELSHQGPLDNIRIPSGLYQVVSLMTNIVDKEFVVGFEGKDWLTVRG